MVLMMKRLRASVTLVYQPVTGGCDRSLHAHRNTFIRYEDSNIGVDVVSYVLPYV